MVGQGGADGESAATGGPLVVEYLGTVSAELCQELELEWVRQRAEEHSWDRLGLAEHFPSYAAGRDWWRLHGDRSKIPPAASLELLDGASPLTFTGPGTLTGYLVTRIPLPLRLADFIAKMKEPVVRLVADLGLEPTLRDKGLFVGERRVARLVTRVRNGIAASRISIDVATAAHWREPLAALDAEPGASLASLVGHAVSLDQVAEPLAKGLAEELRLSLTAGLSGVVGPAGVAEQ